MTVNKQAIEAYAKLVKAFNYQGPDEFAKCWKKDYQAYKGMAKLFKKQQETSHFGFGAPTVGAPNSLFLISAICKRLR